MSAADDLLDRETGSTISLSKLRGSILARVSRSFYLSIRLLPKKLREPVALGYLLARASDTIADTTELPLDLRMENLRLLIRGIQGEALGDAIVGLSASVTPLQKNKAERALIESLQSCLDWLEQSEVPDREEVRAVLEQINRGQVLDLERFRNPKQIAALEKSAELDEYTYLVAGSAGEFWTRLCFRHLPKFSARSEGDMLGMGKRYGMGLQLINILRDAGADLRAGVLFSKWRTCRGRDGAVPNFARTGTLSADLSQMARESGAGDRGRITIRQRDSKSPGPRRDSTSWTDRRAHTCAFAQRRRNRFTSTYQSPAKGSAGDRRVPNFRIRRAVADRLVVSRVI